ncbi:MAG: hypothetical protein CM15mP64_7440 [Candidatus Neomarinimicrobiota bacterium]|nr:MAG: hypothetical protein CM15mP64_7440 [Candidatus Neomarinimicrobiota bacterium]
MLADDELGSKEEDYKVPFYQELHDAFKIFFKIKTRVNHSLKNFDKNNWYPQVRLYHVDIPREVVFEGANRNGKDSQEI